MGQSCNSNIAKICFIDNVFIVFDFIVNEICLKFSVVGYVWIIKVGTINGKIQLQKFQFLVASFSSLLFSSLLFYPYYHPYPLPHQRLQFVAGRRLEDFAQRGCAKANGRMQAESRQAYFNIVIHLLTMFIKTER